MTKSPKEINFQTFITRGTELISSPVDDEIVILSIKNEEYYYLNPIGGLIWKLIAEPISIENVISVLVEQYEVSLELCRSETMTYIEELLQLGIIQLVDE